MQDDFCASCRFCLPSVNGHECRKNPPVLQFVVVDDDGTLTVDYRSGWPDVDLDGWCGAWESKEGEYEVAEEDK